MMLAMGAIKKSVELLKLKTNKLVEGHERTLVLKDDIWEKETLILKSGVYLTEEIINKLLNFGIKRVNVELDESICDKATICKQSHLMKQFINTQSVLVVEKNLINASLLVRILIDNGFKEGNIFVTKDPGAINNYFKAKQINFLFIDSDLYENCKKCVEKYTLLRSTHTFIMGITMELVKFKKSGISKIKFLLKPINEEKLNNLVLEALENNFSKFWNEGEVLIS